MMPRSSTVCRPVLLALATAALLTGCSAPYSDVKRTPAPAAVTGSTPAEYTAAAERHLADAAQAFAQLQRRPADTEARDRYNTAVSQLVATIQTAGWKPWSQPVRVGGRTLTWEKDRRRGWDLAGFELIPVDQLRIHGKYVDEREVRDGVGAPMVARSLADPLHDYAPTPHFYYCATAVLRFEGSRAVLALTHPLSEETVTLGGRRYPLAADFTAPLAMMLVEMHPKDLELPRLLHPAKFADTTRIARLEPFDPNKTVVLVVHGLMASPATWFPLINHLRGDPVIRRNYQFWFFSYPSGYPYPYSAAILRRELDEAERAYPSRKPMVVIGHSMGGCISRLLITDTERKVWDQMFTVPPEKMDLTDEHRHILTESTIFSRRKEIGRVIFISAPHRGSNLASNWLGRFAAGLVQMPANLLSLGSEESKYERHANGQLHLKRFPDSVDTLAPNNEFVLALKQIPPHPDTPYHTLMGDRGKGNAPHSSDGIVPYWSSHLPGAKSERAVPSGHNAHQHPEAFEEVSRLLHLHAGQN